MGFLIVVSAASFVGLLCGSFLNVCISRLPVGESVVAPRSHCRTCGRQLPWFENIPVFSYLALRGKCGGCGVPFSWRYPAVEVGTALWFSLGSLPLIDRGLSTGAFSRLVVHQTAFCLFGFLLIGLMVMDWQHQRLPDSFTIPGIVSGLFLVCADAIFLGPDDYNLVLQRKINLNAAGSGHSTGNVFLTGPEHLVYGRLLSVIVCFLLLFAIRIIYRALRKQDGMGLGDAKLLAMIASLVGLLPAVLAFFLGTLLASAYGMLLLIRRRASGATKLPFGSFLAAGGLLAALTGEPVLRWYQQLFR